METREAVIETLNDLLKIHNDRITGYEKAITETGGLDIDLKSLFDSMIQQSRQHKDELAAMIQRNEGVVEDESTPAGKIYHAWMDIKAAMTESSRVSILASCEFGEDAAQRAYDSALASDVPLDADTRKLVEDQQTELKKSHDIIKTQHDAHKQLQH